MKLTLKSIGSSDPLSNYLKKFGKLRKSLLLEIDPHTSMFTAKSFSEDHSVVRSASLPFDAANYEVVYSDEIPMDKRIKIGIIVTLDKFIKILDRFDTDYNVTFDFDTLTLDNGDADYVCQTITFSSKTLQMRLNGAKVSEFQYLPDDVFNNRIFKLTDFITVSVDANTMQNIIKTSDIVAIDPKNDSLIFYTSENNLYVKDNVGKYDNGKDKESNFNYCIATDVNIAYPIRLPISREKFVQVISGVDEDINIMLGRDVNGEITRILFDAINSDMKIVISALNED